MEEIPIVSFSDQVSSTARERVLPSIEAVIFTATDELTGLSSLLSHAANARAAVAIRNIFFILWYIALYPG